MRSIQNIVLNSWKLYQEFLKNERKRLITLSINYANRSFNIGKFSTDLSNKTDDIYINIFIMHASVKIQFNKY